MFWTWPGVIKQVYSGAECHSQVKGCYWDVGSGLAGL